METQLNLLVQLGTVFIIIFGLFVFMVGAVVIAEFNRRERTTTKDDDWIERKKKGENGE